MNVSFDKSFGKSLDKINDSLLLGKIEKVIINCENASQINDISNLKKMSGFKFYYRIKIADYRVGIELLEDEIHFITVLHRKDIYKKFP